MTKTAKQIMRDMKKRDKWMRDHDTIGATLCPHRPYSKKKKKAK